MRKSLIALCPMCEIEMINIGNNLSHHFVCPTCKKEKGPYTNAFISQEQLDRIYKLEKAILYLQLFRPK